MSYEYDNYLKEHINNVKRAGLYLAENFCETDVFSGVDLDEFHRLLRWHDSTKYWPDEYSAYDAYFYGERDEESFNFAWLHHIHNNPHHWQHWLLVNDDGELNDQGKIVPLEMPKVYALEMIADWWSFSWKSGNLDEIFAWYNEHKDKIILHDNTRRYVESTLSAINEHLIVNDGIVY